MFGSLNPKDCDHSADDTTTVHVLSYNKLVLMRPRVGLRALAECLVEILQSSVQSSVHNLSPKPPHKTPRKAPHLYTSAEVCNQSLLHHNSLQSGAD